MNVTPRPVRLPCHDFDFRVRDLIRSLNTSYPSTLPKNSADTPADLDLESIILTGRIVERQNDRQTGETKVVIRGRTLDGHEAEVVAKVGPTGALYIITVYLV